MIAKVHSAAAVGFDGNLITIECDASNGLPMLQIVGLANKAIDESKERLRSALKNTNLEFPKKRITINLAPASLPKHGSHFDLPMALALLCVSGQLRQEQLDGTLFAGELGLDGALKPIRGVVSYAETAKSSGITTIIVPGANAAQATLVDDIQVIGARSLKEVFLHLKKETLISTFQEKPRSTIQQPSVLLSDIYGQEQAKRALIIAAAGNHNILFDGPPGAGKTMMAKALLSILPPLAYPEIVEATKLHSLAGEIDDEIVTQRPFRAPHHTASRVSLIGGGAIPKPGEISLAHRGVLFLDELPEYPRSVLEALRQPLEDKSVHISRANDHITYPADFMFVATQNPCPCGFLNDETRDCNCSGAEISRYQKKISGPLLDRIDLVVNVTRVEHDKLLKDTGSPADMINKIRSARSRQLKRYNSESQTNASINNNQIKTLSKLSNEAKQLLDMAAKNLNLSARSYFKLIKIARTIADLEDCDQIIQTHIAEALQYRPRMSDPR